MKKEITPYEQLKELINIEFFKLLESTTYNDNNTDMSKDTKEGIKHAVLVLNDKLTKFYKKQKRNEKKNNTQY